MHKTRTGIFGGSFNPIHNGHMAIARAMIERGTVDEVMLMVSPHNPLKNEASLMPENLRLRLAQTACEGEKGITASNFEFSLPRPSYTWQTLTALGKAFPQKEFTLLIGADNWALFDKWFKHDEIISNYKIAIYPRQGFDIEPDKLPEGVSFVSMPLYNVSSTMIRERMARGEDFSDLVPQRVYEALKK